MVLVDLLLFRSRVFRHLLRNRGKGGTEEERAMERTRSMLSLGAVIIGLDACEPTLARLGDSADPGARQTFA